MSFVGIFAKRGGVSIYDAFSHADDEEANVWTVGGEMPINEHDSCFVLKNGRETGEVDDARDVDWEQTIDRIGHMSWTFLGRDTARDAVLVPL